MRTSLQQSVVMKQELRMNPRLYQAMDLLYMPLMELQQHLKEELLTNPFLEMQEPDEDEDQASRFGGGFRNAWGERLPPDRGFRLILQEGSGGIAELVGLLLGGEWQRAAHLLVLGDRVACWQENKHGGADEDRRGSCWGSAHSAGGDDQLKKRLPL